jgi:hypothetical protein
VHAADHSTRWRSRSTLITHHQTLPCMTLHPQRLGSRPMVSASGRTGHSCPGNGTAACPLTGALCICCTNLHQAPILLYVPRHHACAPACRLDEVPVAWTPIGANTKLSLVADAPLGPTNPVALRISAGAEPRLGRGSRASTASGVANSGFWGISIQPQTAYHVSLYLKRASGGPREVHSRDCSLQIAAADR